MPRIVIAASVLAIGACAGALAGDRYAAQNGQAPSAPYATWESAASNIQDAVDKAGTNDTVWVGAGRYTVPPNFTNYAGTNVVFINRPLILRSSNGAPETTIIDGCGSNRGIAVSYPFNSTNKFVVDGFTISNCQAITIGGGIFFDCPINSGNAWTGVVQNCIMQGNTVVYGPGTTNPPIPSSGGYTPNGALGGAIGSHNRDSFFGLSLSNCVFFGNLATNALAAESAGGLGGAIYLASKGQKKFSDCRFQNNRAYRGGGAYLSGGLLTVDNSVISGNSVGYGSQSFGGGFFILSSATLRNCLVYGNNTWAGRGSAINNEAQGSNVVVELYNCTVVSNLSGGYAIYIRPWAAAQSYFPSLHLVNTIVYSNTYDLYLSATASGPPNNYSSYATNSCLGSTNSASIMFGTTNMLYFKGYSSGNITNNPRFVSYVGQNFRLAPDSPCVNRGLNQAWMTNAVDLDGNQRLRYGAVDMGACELVYEGTEFRLH